MKKLKIGIVGWNGMMNIGDDAMTSVIVKHFENILQQNFEIQLFSPNNHLALYTKNDIKIKGLNFFRFFNKKILRRIAYNYIYPEIFSRDKDIILFGGGSIFHRKGTSITHKRIIDSARKRNKENLIIGALGVSIGPFKNEEEALLVKRNLNQMDFVVVRDSRSMSILENMEIKTPYKKGYDIAFLLPKYLNLKIEKPDSSIHTLGLSLRANHVSEEIYIKYGKVISTWLGIDRKNTVKYFNFSELAGQNDGECLIDLLKHIDPKYHNRIQTVNYKNEPILSYKEVMTCKWMICMRLHAAIISYTVKTIPLIESYHQKCLDLAEELNIPKNYILNDKTPKEIISNINSNDSFADIDGKYNFLMSEAKNHFYFLDNMIKNY